jgi:dihydrolipoamide dehydrogenase
MANEHFDIVFIGSGPGGYVSALKAAQLGAKTAVVEKGHLGGACLNNGCIPSKALLGTAELMHTIANAGQMGVRVEGSVSLDWPTVQARKDKVLAKLRGGIKSLFGARGVTLFQGEGKLDGTGKVVVTAGGKSTAITADKVILAVGSVPSRIPGWPEDARRICTSDDALHWKDLPKRLLIVGGGVIGCEFACMMQAFGVEVTVVEMMPRLLPEMDAELARALGEIFAKRRIQMFTGVKVAELSLTEGGVHARLENGKEIDADRVLVATGRRPATQGIGLESVDLTTDRGFVRVNDRMETAAKGVYCIGDANGRCLLAHAASAQGMVAVANALGGDHAADKPVPWAVFTFPEIAGVGLTQQQAAKQGLPISIGMFPVAYLGKAMAVNHTDGFVKTIRNRETDQLLGVHMIGHNATEVIAAAGAMLGLKASATDLAETIIAHPTMAETLKESAEDSLGMAMHLPPRKVVQLMGDVK